MLRFKAAQTRGSTARSTALSEEVVLKMPAHEKMSRAESGFVLERGGGRGREAPAQEREPVGQGLLVGMLLR